MKRKLSDEGSVIWSFSGCRHTGTPAKWKGKKWICQDHGVSKCVTSYKNEELLDKLAGRDKIEAEHPSWPTDEEIAKRKKELKRSIIYHSFTFWVQEPIKTLEEWEALNDRLEAAFDVKPDHFLGTKAHHIKHMGTMGPIPGTSDE